jgi:hypothetical protein
MSDHNTTYLAVFGPLTFDCECRYSVDTDAPHKAEELLVDRVSLLTMQLDKRRGFEAVHSTESGLEGIAEEIGDYIGRTREAEIRAVCIEHYKRYHQERKTK